jgi:chromosome partitioning protein
MHKTAICIRKGGCGKTSTTVHLAGVLAEAGNEVLVVDCDWQGNATAFLLGNQFDGGEATLAAIFAGQGLPMTELIRPSPFANVHVLPADERLNDHDRTTGYLDDVEAVSALADEIGTLAGVFDHVLFDCPTARLMTSFAALVAADSVIIPWQPGEDALRGLADVQADVREARARYSPKLRIAGCLLNRCDSRDPTSRQARADIMGALPDAPLFRTEIPESKWLRRARQEHKPITSYRPRSREANLFRAFTQEFLGGLEHVQLSRAA